MHPYSDMEDIPSRQHHTMRGLTRRSWLPLFFEAREEGKCILSLDGPAHLVVKVAMPCRSIMFSER